MSEFEMSRAELNAGLFAEETSQYVLVTEDNKGTLYFIEDYNFEYENDMYGNIIRTMFRTITTPFFDRALQLESGSPLFELFYNNDPTLLLYKVESKHTYNFIHDWTELIEESKP